MLPCPRGHYRILQYIKMQADKMDIKDFFTMLLIYCKSQCNDSVSHYISG